jgi:DNA polymerase III delta subunit
MIYLFVGEDSTSKDTQLKILRQRFLKKETEQFNLDILYAKELTLKALQERLLYLAVKDARRIIIIKDAQNLNQDCKDFILRLIKNPYEQIILILDVITKNKNDEFINRLERYARVYRFKESPKIDTFTLSRNIELKRPDIALRVLNQLLERGEKPERILGGLRYVWENKVMSPIEMGKKFRLLLNCDIEIKTGRLKPVFALEKLVINLCGFSKPFH